MGEAITGRLLPDYLLEEESGGSRGEEKERWKKTDSFGLTGECERHSKKDDWIDQNLTVGAGTLDSRRRRIQ